MGSRVLRDDLWTSERVNALHDKTFRLYICLINAADDYGLVEVGFGAIRRAAPLLSWSREEVAKMLGELTDAELIRPYQHEGKPYAAMEKWRANVNSYRPKNPIPSFGMGHCGIPLWFKDFKTRRAAALILKHLPIESGPPAVHESPTRDALETKREEVRGKREEVREKKKEKDGRAPRARRPVVPIPDDFALTDALIAHGKKLGLTGSEVERAFGRFCDNARAKAHTYADWPAAFRTWCGFDADRKRKEDPEIDLTDGGRYIVE
jgi:hypothetical protein